ncbi:hypothetical protein [Niallia sp. FSL W8-0635]|uniref:hypothetical protein n=1 Tax=Niallia sp. FSL W8-0635 TaxID=2975337 RepID=UPI0009C8216F|nr:Uncharacterised protein [Mycobacteroides abscessus subsp. abscessus]HEO8422009.1 hypothetical protein [Yersinia enterocolitica]
MDEKLKNLDEKMNETVLKEITFSEVNKQRVLKKINYSKKSTNGIIYVRKYFPVAVSVVLIVIFFTEIIPFIGSQSKISEGNVRNEVSIYNELSNQIGDVESNEIEMQYNRSLATQYPDKFAIVKKMCRSYSNIHSAYGKFEYRNSDRDEPSTVSFYLDIDKGLYKSTLNYWDKGSYTLLKYLWKDEIFTIERPSEENYVEELDKQKFKDTGLPGVIFNNEWYVLLLDNYENWSYKETKKFNRAVYEIEGNYPFDSEYDTVGGPFSVTIDKETGTVFNLAYYDHRDLDRPARVMVNVKNISINEGVPENIFSID